MWDIIVIFSLCMFGTMPVWTVAWYENRWLFNRKYFQPGYQIKTYIGYSGVRIPVDHWFISKRVNDTLYLRNMDSFASEPFQCSIKAFVTVYGKIIEIINLEGKVVKTFRC